MPFPVEITGAYGCRRSIQQRIGPYTYNGVLYVMAFSELPSTSNTGKLNWFKSLDGGQNWSILATPFKEVKQIAEIQDADEENPRSVETIPHDSFPVVPYVYVIYIDTSSNLHASRFDFSSETYTQESSGDPRVYLLASDDNLIGPFAAQSTMLPQQTRGDLFYGDSSGTGKFHILANLAPVSYCREPDFQPPFDRVWRATLDRDSLVWSDVAKLLVQNDTAFNNRQYEAYGTVQASSNAVYGMYVVQSGGNASSAQIGAGSASLNPGTGTFLNVGVGDALVFCGRGAFREDGVTAVPHSQLTLPGFQLFYKMKIFGGSSLTIASAPFARDGVLVIADDSEALFHVFYTDVDGTGILYRTYGSSFNNDEQLLEKAGAKLLRGLAIPGGGLGLVFNVTDVDEPLWFWGLGLENSCCCFPSGEHSAIG